VAGLRRAGRVPHDAFLGQHRRAIYTPDPADRRGARVYFDVDDINAGAARVRELGGEAGDAMPVPAMGWFALCTDTEGNDFGLWQNDSNAAAPA
jgi:predicted enzyme related to lactoylglutathione lyase